MRTLIPLEVRYEANALPMPPPPPVTRAHVKGRVLFAISMCVVTMNCCKGDVYMYLSNDIITSPNVADVN